MRGLLFSSGTCHHTYPLLLALPHALIYCARSTWYIETTRFKERLTGLNQTIHWHPEHIQDGRFGNWLAHNVDWALGRERYWGTPLPVWICDHCEHPDIAWGQCSSWPTSLTKTRPARSAPAVCG